MTLVAVYMVGNRGKVLLQAFDTWNEANRFIRNSGLSESETCIEEVDEDELY